MRLLRQADPDFSLASERTYRRFGDSPLMERFLSQLESARAPEIKSSAVQAPESGDSYAELERRIAPQ